MAKLEGVMPALFTNYDGAGEVTDDGLEKQLSFYIEAGCRGFFVGGSTGEGLLQTVEERCRFIEAVVGAVSGQVPVIAHVGALATRDACEIARFAAKAGADFVGSVLPVYYPVGIEGMAAYYRAIGEAAELPMLVYYLAYAGTAMTAEQFAENLATLPHVCALKYTSPELETFRKIVELTDDDMTMIMGCDQLLLPALTLGADGGIGTTYNFMPEIIVGIYESYHAGEMQKAEELMARAFRTIQAIKKYPPLSACREVTRMRGFDTGRCRGPIPTLTDEQAKALRKDMEEIGFFTDPIR